MRSPTYEGKEIYVGQVIQIDDIEYKVTAIDGSDVMFDACVLIPFGTEAVNLIRNMEEDRCVESAQYTYKDPQGNLVNEITNLEPDSEVEHASCQIDKISTRPG